ncbi:MAG: hypothetical protein ACXVCY_18625 [Pseudobdellovibrionaceae bacterium]
MSRFQALICLAIFSLLYTEKVFALECRLYQMDGLILENEKNVVMLINPASRSEVKVQFPDFMQKVLKNYLNNRIEVQAPAQRVNDSLYQVFYKEGRVKNVPLSPQKHDQIRVINEQKPFPCE